MKNSIDLDVIQTTQLVRDLNKILSGAMMQDQEVNLMNVFNRQQFEYKN